MLEITHEAASAAILKAADEDRLVQHHWHQRHQGRDFACLLGSIHPEVKSASDCNAALMPLWLAELTVTLFDGLPQSEIVPVARRYGALVGRWHALSPQAWDRVLTRFLIRTIDDAVAAARPVAEGKPYWPAVDAACAQCRTAIESGDGAARAAGAASWAAEAAARAAGAASWAAGGAGGAGGAAYLSLFTFLLDQIEAELP